MTQSHWAVQLNAWTAWTALGVAFVVGTITLSVVDIGKSETLGNPRIVNKWIPAWENLPAKSRHMLWGIGEDIEVSGPTPEIEKLAASLCIHNILWRDGRTRVERSKASSSFGIGRDKSGADLCGLIVVIESARQRRISQYAFAMHGHASSRSIATVFPIWSESPIIVSCIGVDFPEWRDPRGEDKGPLTSDHRIAGYVRSFLGGGYGCLHVASLRGASAPSDDPKTYRRYGKNAGKADQPQSEISNRIVDRLFPKALFVFFLSGAMFGLLFLGCVLLWGHIRYSSNKTASQYQIP